jgi:hypothetical protein
VKPSLHYAETQCGFDWGAAKVIRAFSDPKQGYVWMMIETPKHKERNVLQIYVTKSGKIRVYDGSGEWTKANEVKP